MKIKRFNVSSFLITTKKGIRIITDPYYHNYRPEDPPPNWGVRPGIEEYADIVTISHAHFDHSYMYAVKGVPRLYTGGAPAEIKGIKLSSVVTHHGDNRGYNNLIGIEADGIRIRHLGDMGKRKLTEKQLAQVGRVDILMTPWDDNNICMPHTLLAEVLDQLKPKVILPMHHAKIDDFMTGRKGFTKLDNISEMEFEANNLPSEEKIYFLQPTLEL